MSERNLPEALILVQESRTRRQKRGLILDPELAFLDREIVMLARDLEGTPGRWLFDESAQVEEAAAKASTSATSFATPPAAGTSATPAVESEATPAAESGATPAAETEVTPAPAVSKTTTTTSATVSTSETPVTEFKATAATAETSEGAATASRSATPSEGNTEETAGTEAAILPQKKISTEMTHRDGLEFDPKLFLILNPEVRHQLMSQMLMEKWLLRRCAPTTRVQMPFFICQNFEDKSECSSVISVDIEDVREYNRRNGVRLENIVELENEPRVSFGSRVRAFCRRMGRSLRRCFSCGRRRAAAEE